MTKDLVCIVCPVGCRLTIEKDQTAEQGYKITGNKCKRGIAYGIEEMTHPTRMVPTTVKIEGAFLNRLPVRTDKPISKNLIFKAMDVINDYTASAPVKMGDVLIENILGTDVNIIATRSMKRG
jgi:CxxC motif-containing protein